MLALILVVKKSIESAVTIFGNTLRNPDTVFSNYLESGAIMIGHILLGGIIAFSAIYVALQIFIRLTKDLDELKAIDEAPQPSSGWGDHTSLLRGGGFL